MAFGCVAKLSKFDIHMYDFPKIDLEICTKCDRCMENCSSNAIQDYRIVEERCLKCLGCPEVCEDNAVKTFWVFGEDVSERIVECVKSVFEVQKNFAHINFLIDITPHYDCHPYSDIPVVSDLGIMASKDILAIDKASVDLYMKAREY